MRATAACALHSPPQRAVAMSIPSWRNATHGRSGVALLLLLMQGKDLLFVPLSLLSLAFLPLLQLRHHRRTIRDNYMSRFHFSTLVTRQQLECNAITIYARAIHWLVSAFR